ncbi:MAG: MFS transporter [Thaumarchaeota archaeon]|nr:MFS transporter [Nitrososphaerota archaeon]
MEEDSEMTEGRAEIQELRQVDSRHATRTLLVLTGVALLVNYVETMVIPGIPTIQKDLATTASIASWITTAYLIVGSSVSLLFGKLGDIYGKKKMFLFSLTFYITGVVIAGFSPSIYFLLFARALQGIGFAIIPLALAILTDVYPREKIATAQGIISGTFAIGAAAGLIVGSYVVQDLGWQYAFHTAAVLSVLLFLVAAKILRNDKPSGTRKSVDYAGAGLIMAGVTLLLLYVTEGPTLGWFSLREMALLIPGVLATLYFFAFENGKAEPLIQLGLLKIRNVLVANLVGIVSGTMMFMLFFAAVYYMELPTGFGLNLDIIAAGLSIGPSTLGMLIGGPTIGRMILRSGPKPALLLGSAVLGIGQVLFIFNRATSTALALDMLVALFGLVSVIVPIVNMVAVSLPRESIAVGLGMNTMLRNLGGALGPVVATTIMSSFLSPYIVSVKGHEVVAGQLPSAFAFDLIFAIGIALSIGCIGLSLAIKNYTFKERPE